MENIQYYKKIKSIKSPYRHKCNCRCHCHHNLLLLDNNFNSNLRENKTNINIIKTETNNNLIKSYVIYKNQIKPLYFSKIGKKINKSNSNIKKYSYGGTKLKTSTITNNHSYKEIKGGGRDEKFFKDRAIKFIENNKSGNYLDYSYNFNNNISEDKNIDNKKDKNIIKDVKINEQKLKKCSSYNGLKIKTEDIFNNNIENKYDVFINNLSNKFDNFYNNNDNSDKTGNKINNKYYYINLKNNFYNNKKNFRYYYDYKKNILEKKKKILKTDIENYKTDNDNYEDIRLKIKLGLLKRYIHNNELKNKENKNKRNIDYILLEKTREILKQKDKLYNKNNKTKKDKEENNTLNKLKKMLENKMNNNFKYHK